MFKRMVRSKEDTIMMPRKSSIETMPKTKSTPKITPKPTSKPIIKVSDNSTQGTSIKSRPFKTLPISTQTVMAYANCTFDIEAIFQKLPVEDIGDTPIKKINGALHGKIYQLKRAGQVRGVPTKKGHFRNQITTYIYILDKMITVKIFPTGKFHLTGCKGVHHQQQAIVELVNYIRKFNTLDNPTYKMEDDQPLNVTLEVVMVNVDFHLGFEVDQKKLDRILQEEDNDFHSVFETPVNTSVNIKLEYPDPTEKKYQQIVFQGTTKKPKVIFSTIGECPKARRVEKRTHTFLVFSSSKVIQSGRYYESEMEPAYRKFNEFIVRNRKDIELSLKNHTFDMNCLTGLTSVEPLRIRTPKK